MKSLEELDRLFFHSLNAENDEELKIKMDEVNRHYVTVEDAAPFYSIEKKRMKKVAINAGAMISAFGIKYALIDCDLFEEYLERCRLETHGLVKDDLQQRRSSE